MSEPEYVGTLELSAGFYRIEKGWSEDDVIEDIDRMVRGHDGHRPGLTKRDERLLRLEVREILRGTTRPRHGEGDALSGTARATAERQAQSAAKRRRAHELREQGLSIPQVWVRMRQDHKRLALRTVERYLEKPPTDRTVRPTDRETPG